MDLVTLDGDETCATLGPDYVPARTFFITSVYGSSKTAYEGQVVFAIGLDGG